MAAGDKALLRPAICVVGIMLLSACTSVDATGSISPKPATTKAVPIPSKAVYHYTPIDRDCLKRAMYFESKRSSKEGLLAVGTVVMNRLTSGAYADTICGVVGQERQFAPGVMTRQVNDASTPELDAAVDAIIRGERNRDVKDAMFFHRDGMKFPYPNMHYTAVAGGNAFYEKRDRDGELQTPPPKATEEYVLALVRTGTDPLSLMQASEPSVAIAAPAIANNTAAPAVTTALAIAPTGPIGPGGFIGPIANNDLMIASAVPVPLHRPEPIKVTNTGVVMTDSNNWAIRTAPNQHAPVAATATAPRATMSVRQVQNIH